MGDRHQLAEIVNLCFPVEKKTVVTGAPWRAAAASIRYPWYIDRENSGNYYLNFKFGMNNHPGEGAGDGIWSIFTIIDALYDSKPGETIIIDEPELSLHPAYQKKMVKLFTEKAKDRQIIISTHSPYFIDFQSLSNGANLIHCTKNSAWNIEVHSLSKESKDLISGLLENINNPHILGLNAKEVFFLPDNIILVEGQEDVVIFEKIFNKLQSGEFFGWGVGGADNMPHFLNIFNDLGYKKVIAIFDHDKEKEYKQLEDKYEQYQFILLPTDDIRDKKERTIKKKDGLTDSSGNIKEQHNEFVNETIAKIDHYFTQK